MSFDKVLALVDRECAKYSTSAETDPMDPRRRIYTVRISNDRKQMVVAGPIEDPMFGARLDFVSIAVSELPKDKDLLIRVLGIALGLRRARLCVLDPNRPQLAVVASFVPDELQEDDPARLIAAMREVAAVADSIEAALIGADRN